MNPYTLGWKLDQEISIKEFLKEQGISRRALSKIKYAGGSIVVNGKEQNVRYILKENDELQVFFPEEKINPQMKGENIPLSIIYEDEDCIILDKPAYMNTIPSHDHPSGSVANGLVYYYEKNNIHSAVHIVTRLDRNTSGLVLIAKHRHAHHLFSLMQQQRQIDRTYEAIVQGVLQQSTFTIDAPIGRKSTSIIEREVRSDGQEAITHLSLIQAFSTYSHVRLVLETGRTHQIRVHMAHIGHPLLGDHLYGSNDDRISRQALHCRKLQFIHPMSREKLEFTSELPKDIKNLLLHSVI